MEQIQKVCDSLSTRLISNSEKLDCTVAATLWLKHLQQLAFQLLMSSSLRL